MHKRLIQALLGALVFVAYSTQTVAAGNDEPHDLTPALRATPLLLKMGMVNPKDGEYRQIEVVIDSGWHKTRKVKTHGWVLAGDGKHALCWNGQLYSLESVGSPADLRSDVLAATIGSDQYIPEGIDWRSCDNRKIPLLLCLGQRDLASQLWTASDSKIHSGKQGKGTTDEWYVNGIMKQFLFAWLTGLWDRAAGAHELGDDAIALACVQQYVDALKGPAAAALKSDEREGNSQGFEALAEQLLKDQQRRNAKKKVGASPASSDPAQAGQARFLIEQLDEATGHVEAVPGPTCMDDNTSFDQLLKLGPSAVGSLIECLDTDPRLTRIVQRGRPWSPAIGIEPVSQIAYTALCAIIGREFGTSDQPWESERHELAKKIRQYWGMANKEPVEKRWLNILADDRAQNQWLDAANNIVTPANNEPGCSSATGAVTYVDAYIPMMIEHHSLGKTRGEQLRSETKQSVSGLMSKRAFEMWKSNRQHEAVHMIMDLGLWDGRHQVDDIKRFSQMVAATKNFRAPKVFGEFETWSEILGNLYEARLVCGDRTAIDDYFKMIRSIIPQNVEGDKVFTFIFHRYGDSGVQKQTDLLFSDRSSSWNPKHSHTASGFRPDLWASPLLSSKIVRALCLEFLADRKTVGKSFPHSSNGRAGVDLKSATDVMCGPYEADSGTSMFLKDRRTAPRDASAKQSYDFNTADFVASRLSRVDGFPRFALNGNLKERKAAIETSIKLLTQYGAALSRRESITDLYGQAQIQFAFPQLSKPATPADVSNGLAMFSLSDKGSASVVPLKLPAEAFRKDAALAKSSFDPEQGTVWQAEEVTIAGSKKRFYGFVSKHFFGLLPAKQVVIYESKDSKFSTEPSAH
jgi:hypothetical protein